MLFQINKSGDLKVSSLSLDNLVMRGTQLRYRIFVIVILIFVSVIIIFVSVIIIFVSVIAKTLSSKPPLLSSLLLHFLLQKDAGLRLVYLRTQNLYFLSESFQRTAALFMCRLYRNTDYVYGCAVYTGRDTKMTKNSKITGNKFSTVEKTMNKELGPGGWN